MPTITNNQVYFQAPWQAPANVHTCITTSVNNFNLAKHVNDDPQKVLACRIKLRNLLPKEPFWLNQIHGSVVINQDSHLQGCSLDADASITRQKNQVAVVMTADCLPILLTSTQGDFVAAIHAGWRGLNSQIIEKTIIALGNPTAKNILAFIGPAICQKCFEIGGEVRDEFLKIDPTVSDYFIPGKSPDKYHADLRQIAAYQLRKLGLDSANITNPDICTKCNVHWFFSYRENPNTGRFATLIWID